MSVPASRRDVSLLVAGEGARSAVRADLYRNYPVSALDNVQRRWTEARREEERRGTDAGLPPLEHEHWDWRNKVDSVEAGLHLLVAVECQGDAQGLMAVFRTPRRGKLTGGPVLYVDYLEAAPWNLKGRTASARFLGVGTVLIAEAVRMSLEMGLYGKVGLHSLPQAESFYAIRCQMSRLGPDPLYFDLTYFEFTQQQANDWLASIGEPS